MFLVPCNPLLASTVSARYNISPPTAGTGGVFGVQIGGDLNSLSTEPRDGFLGAYPRSTAIQPNEPADDGVLTPLGPVTEVGFLFLLALCASLLYRRRSTRPMARNLLKKRH